MLATGVSLFIAGLLTILLPCILPLIPIVLGVSITDRRGLRPLVIIAGMLASFVGFTFLLQVVLSQFVELADYIRLSTYYVLLLFGLGFAFHRRWVHFLGAALGALFFIDKGAAAVIGAAVLGCFAMEAGGRVASRIQQWGTDVQQSARQGLGAESLLTAFIIGLTLGLVWVPCAGPALGFALTLVRDEPGALALLYLFLYGLGTAIPLLLIGYGGQRAVHSVRFLSRYSGRVKEIAGILLILSAVAFRFDLFLKLQAFFVEHTSYGTLGTDLEERLFGESLRTMGMPSASSIPGSVQSGLPVLGAAPEEFVQPGTWHNSPPLRLKDLRGSVVLIDFWTYSCINCIRTLPYLRGYWEKYRGQPFIMIGVHSPEFIFEKSDANVAAAIKKYALSYPVVQDNDFGIWRSFNNRYWPAKYLIDAEGRIRYTHFGEGSYEETDEAIASLLLEIGVEQAGGEILEERPSGRPVRLTAETYLGPRSWNSLQNRQGFPTGQPIAYAAPERTELHQYVLDGLWQLADDERQVLLSDRGEIRIRALAGEVNLVLGVEPGTQSVAATVEVDGQETSSFIVDQHDLYTLFKGEYGEHDIVLRLQGKGVAGYAFTFGR